MNDAYNILIECGSSNCTVKFAYLEVQAQQNHCLPQSRRLLHYDVAVTTAQAPVCQIQ